MEVTERRLLDFLEVELEDACSASCTMIVQSSGLEIPRYNLAAGVSRVRQLRATTNTTQGMTLSCRWLHNVKC